MNIGFKNTRSILILGAASDIARGVAARFARENFTLILAGRDTAFLDRIRCDLSIRENADARVVYFDALDFASHQAFYRSLDPRPDTCVCVFGYLGDQQDAESDWAESSHIIDVNYKGAVSILNIVAADFAAKGQ